MKTGLKARRIHPWVYTLSSRNRPYAELLPETRWFPAAEELRAKAYERLLPPLVARIAVGFRLDYLRADGDLSNYTPDFIVKTVAGTVFIIETKGHEEIDLPQKMTRLKDWCADANAASKATGGPEYRHLFVDQGGFEDHTPRDFGGLANTFLEFQK